MLKPFLIKDLLDPALDQLSYDPHNASPAGRLLPTPTLGHTYDGIVEISRSEYDETILNLPEAKLHYFDEDDGETVTVGSSLELVQRLDEPAEISTLPANLAHDGLERAPIHVFDINKSSSTILKWRSFHARYSMLDTSVHPSSYSTLLSHQRKTRGICSPSELAHRPKLQIQTIVHENSSPCDLKSTSPFYASKQNLSSTDTDIGLPLTGLLEWEDQSLEHDIQEPGQFLSQHHPQTSACYQPPSLPQRASKSDRDGYTLTEREPKSQESPIEEQSQSFLAAFEAELSKVVMPDLSTETTKNEGARSAPAEAPSDSQAGVATEPDPKAHFAPRTAQLVGHTVQTLLSSLAQLTSELKSKFPEIERRLAVAQQQVPTQVETTVQDTLTTMTSHFSSLAKAVQDAATSTQAAATRSEPAGMRAAQADGLRGFALELSEMRKTLFTAFQSGFSSMSANESPSGKSRAVSGDPVEALNTQLPPQLHTADSSSHYGRNEGHILLIRGLDSTITSGMIKQLLLDHGFVASVAERHEGIAYIYFPSIYAATGALRALQDTAIAGRKLDVEYSQYSPGGDIPYKPSISMPHLTQPISRDDDLVASSQPDQPLDSSEQQQPQQQQQHSNVAADSLGVEGPSRMDDRSRIPLDIMPATEHTQTFHTSITSVPRTLTNLKSSGRTMTPRVQDGSSPKNFEKTPTGDDLSLHYPPLSSLLGHPPCTFGNVDRDMPTQTTVSPSQMRRPIDADSPRHIPLSISQLLSQGQANFAKASSLPPVPDKVPGSWPKYQEDITENNSSLSPFPLATTIQNSTNSLVHCSTRNETSSRPDASSSDCIDFGYLDNPTDEKMKIEACVAVLCDLGYNRDRMPISRLRVYVEAANYNVGEAIEMIEEDRKASEEQWATN
ncbi:hypothetical protein LOZ00_002239 [Ophidiomyces ophidiicola]|nr:hypothetical protein LOZ00_002239 [Ophidiomyces ophidiicola]